MEENWPPDSTKLVKEGKEIAKSIFRGKQPDRIAEDYADKEKSYLHRD